MVLAQSRSLVLMAHDRAISETQLGRSGIASGVVKVWPLYGLGPWPVATDPIGRARDRPRAATEAHGMTKWVGKMP